MEGELLAVEFRIRDAEGTEIARVDKDFTGLAREVGFQMKKECESEKEVYRRAEYIFTPSRTMQIFTDMRQYVIHFDPNFNIPVCTMEFPCLGCNDPLRHTPFNALLL